MSLHSQGSTLSAGAAVVVLQSASGAACDVCCYMRACVLAVTSTAQGRVCWRFYVFMPHEHRVEYLGILQTTVTVRYSRVALS